MHSVRSPSSDDILMISDDSGGDDMDMGAIGQTLSVGGILATAVIWICKSMFNPLKETMDKVSKLLDRLNDRLDDEQAERHRLEVRVQEIDDRGKSNTHRIDSLEKRVLQ